MKRIFLFFCLLTIATSISAQTTVKPYNVGSFNSVDISGIYSVEIEKSGANSVKVETQFEMFKYLDIKVRDGILVLSLDTDRMPRSLRRNTPDINVKISMATLERVKMSGASKLIVKSEFKSPVFKLSQSGASYADIISIEGSKTEIDVSGASKLKIRSKGNDLDIDLSGASSLTATLDYKFLKGEFSGASNANCSGIADEAEIQVSGATSLKAESLKLARLNIRASGASKANMGNLKEISIYASGASSIRYYGNPVVRIKEVSGASSVKQLD